MDAGQDLARLVGHLLVSGGVDLLPQDAPGSPVATLAPALHGPHLFVHVHAVQGLLREGGCGLGHGGLLYVRDGYKEKCSLSVPSHKETCRI